MRRVDGVDAAFLAAETPEWHFHVTALQIIDPTGVPGFGFETFRDLCERRMHLIPQFRWSLVSAPLGLGWSYLVDDHGFDASEHLHRVAVPAPGGRRELGELTGEIMGIKIDRGRPLWEVWFIEGLEDGRVALLMKVHHSIIDGQSGAEVAAALYDLAPIPPAAEEPPPHQPEPLPSGLEVMARNALHAATVPLRMLRLGRDLVGRGVASLPMTLANPRPALPFQAPRTRFNGQLTPRRGFACASLPLDLVKQVKKAAGVKVNDVVLAVCSGALRTYLLELDELPETPLIAQVPVSTRTDATRSEVRTQVGAMFVSLATHLTDPLARLRAVTESSSAGKQWRGVMGEHHTITLSEALPPPLFALAARTWSLAHLDAHSPPIYNVIISNVAGPPVDFYVAGARIEAMYPNGPLLYGGGLNITCFSNGGTLDVGLMTCPDLVPDPWPLADAFLPALEELANAALLQFAEAEEVPA